MSGKTGNSLVLEHPRRIRQSLQVLIVKLGWTETLVADQGTTCSLGDVLRTTPILHLFKTDHVTWLTDSRAVDLLPGRPYIDEVLTYGSEAYGTLLGRKFDWVINLECDNRLTDILSGITYRKWSGFPIWTAKVLGHHESDQDIKDGLLSGMDKGRTWVEMLFEMVGAEYHGQGMILGNVEPTDITHDLGFNIKVGPKWPTKAWPEDRWGELAERLQGKYTFDFQRHLNDLKGYIAWINRCRLLVTNDSLGLHIAQALGKKVVGLFGPTRFDTFPEDEKTAFVYAQPRLSCQPCYRAECDRSCECMRNITAERVARAVEQLMG